MTTLLAVSVLAALAALALALNHLMARLSLVEVTLNEGLPPGYEHASTSNKTLADPEQVQSLLGPGVHIFLSRNCHACMRLIDELHAAPLRPLAADSSLHFRYIDRPRPIATSAAQASGAILDTNDGELAAQVGADPLPYTIAVGDGSSLSRGVSPTRKQVVTLSHDAGIQGFTSAAARAER